MSEKNVNPEFAVYRIDALPFLAGFVGGPLLFTLCTFWIAYIPVYALMLGGPVYAIVGLPVALIHLRHNPGTTSAMMNLAIKSLLIISAPLALISLAAGGLTGLGALVMILAVSILFALGWAGCAAAIYNRLRSDQSLVPHSPNLHGGCFA